MTENPGSRDIALARFEAMSQWPMILLALIYAGLLVLPLFHSLKQPEQHEISLAEYFIWAFFAAEYSIRFAIAPQKIDFVRSNILDLIIVILPFLRPLRVFRAFVAVRFIVALLRGTKAIRTAFRRKNISYVFLIAAIWVGDRYPVTPEGRGLAVALMIVGLALTGVVAGSLASFFMEQNDSPSNSELTVIADRLSAIERHLGVPTRLSEEET